MLPSFTDMVEKTMEELAWMTFSERISHKKTKNQAKSDKTGHEMEKYLVNEVRSSVEQGTTAMEKLVEKLGNAEEKAECKKLMKELEKARFSNTFLQRPNEAIDVSVEDEKSPSSEARGSP
ncbi:hypothetical protein Tco_0487134 [Tanacetum coccineum]